MVSISRREALVAGAAVGLQVLAATGAAEAAPLRRLARSVTKPGYGPLAVQTGEMSVPAGFTVIPFGAAGTPMSDGLKTPMWHDGTLAADAGGGRVHLIRNHEGFDPGKALGRRNAYDRVAQGGVTTSLFDTASGTLVGSSLVLNGTDNNCNGGRTPWGSWLSCEESTVGPADGFEKRHGYVFEVPFGATSPVDPVPIKAMGRFEHEATAIDPKTGIVYMTEDNGDPGDGFYRYLPNNTTKLHRGGKLQMLAVGSVYFVASESGNKGLGQIWRYTPDGLKHGKLTLLYESANTNVLDQPDALVVSPRGGVVVCEDGDGEDSDGGTNFLRCLAPTGDIVTFARNDTPLDLHKYDDAPKGAIGRSEWSGACYSPDGKWLFVHIQIPGKTYAITGPWEQGWL